MKFDFNELYEEHYEHILNFIKKRVSSVEDAEDLASKTFEKVFKNLSDFKWQGISIKSWIFTIARNNIIDFYRKNSKYEGQVQLDSMDVQGVDSDKDLMAALLEEEDEKKLYLAISSLQPDDQYLIYYKYFEELSVAEISERTGLTETNISTKLYRLRKRLIKQIKEDEPNSKTKK